MTRKGFDNKLQELHSDILRMGSIVQKQIHQSIDALVNKDETSADQIIENDDIVDKMEKEIEDKCILLIAKEQPLATDLRTVFTTIKIVTDLERMADHAVDIAKVTKRIRNEKYIKELIDIPKMEQLVINLIRSSLDAYVDMDEQGAYTACKIDDEIDGLYKIILNDLFEIMTKDNSTISQGTQFMFVCKYLERIADHATNICEWTIYLISGEYIDMNV